MNQYQFQMGGMTIWRRHSSDQEALDSAKDLAEGQGKAVLVLRQEPGIRMVEVGRHPES